VDYLKVTWAAYISFLVLITFAHTFQLSKRRQGLLCGVSTRPSTRSSVCTV